MTSHELSGDQKITLPALIAPPTSKATTGSQDISEQPYYLPDDLVEAFYFLQQRFHEVRAETDEELYGHTEVAYYLGLRLMGDPQSLLRFIAQPLFQQRLRPLKPHHKLNPLLLAVQFLFNARTEKARKRASAIAIAIRNFVGENPQPGEITKVLRQFGYDGLARANAKPRRKQNSEDAESPLLVRGEAKGTVAEVLKALRPGDRTWILAEHAPTKQGRHRLQFVATQLPDPGGKVIE